MIPTGVPVLRLFCNASRSAHVVCRQHRSQRAWLLMAGGAQIAPAPQWSCMTQPASPIMRLRARLSCRSSLPRAPSATPAKAACLTACQSRLASLPNGATARAVLSRWSPARRHCLGCCWARLASCSRRGMTLRGWPRSPLHPARESLPGRHACCTRRRDGLIAFGFFTCA